MLATKLETLQNLIFDLSKDLHILQTTYITNKSITKITVCKTQQQKH